MSSALHAGAPPGWRAGVPFAVIGSACVVAGGLVAAALAHAPSQHAMWAAAYLVLVAGVAQIGLGAGHALATAAAPSRAILACEVTAWNAGNAAVLGGTLYEVPAISQVGGLLLGVTLVLALIRTRGARPTWWLRGYRYLMIIVLVSIPIGLALQHGAGT